MKAEKGGGREERRVEAGKEGTLKAGENKDREGAGKWGGGREGRRGNYNDENAIK